MNWIMKELQFFIFEWNWFWFSKDIKHENWIFVQFLQFRESITEAYNLYDNIYALFVCTRTVILYFIFQVQTVTLFSANYWKSCKKNRGCPTLLISLLFNCSQKKFEAINLNVLVFSLCKLFFCLWPFRCFHSRTFVDFLSDFSRLWYNLPFLVIEIALFLKQICHYYKSDLERKKKLRNYCVADNMLERFCLHKTFLATLLKSNCPRLSFESTSSDVGRFIFASFFLPEVIESFFFKNSYICISVPTEGTSRIKKEQNAHLDVQLLSLTRKLKLLHSFLN